jgi:hypothetical protein
VTSLDEMKFSVTATAAVTPQTLENTWKEIEHRLVISHAIKDVRVEVLKFFL